MYLSGRKRRISQRGGAGPMNLPHQPPTDQRPETDVDVVRIHGGGGIERSKSPAMLGHQPIAGGLL